MTQIVPPENEDDVEALLEHGRLQIVGEPEWSIGDQDVRAELPVKNSGGHPVRMYLRFPRAIHGRYHYVLVAGRMCMRRLDVRDSHTNPGPEPKETWALRTHKHRWTDDWFDRVAYTPRDLPDTSSSRVTEDEYREVFEAFCRECNVDLSDFRWENPPIPVRTTP